MMITFPPEDALSAKASLAAWRIAWVFMSLTTGLECWSAEIGESLTHSARNSRTDVAESTSLCCSTCHTLKILECRLDSQASEEQRNDMEHLGGWTEVHSKKTQQKMKALSRQSSANKLVGSSSLSNANPMLLVNKKQRQSTQAGTVDPTGGGKHNRHSSKLKASNVPSKSLKKSYSQALSHEGKDRSLYASIPRPELSPQTSKETIIVSEVFPNISEKINTNSYH